MSDTEVALKFRGRWCGKWAIGDHDGDFVLVVTKVLNCTVEGEAFWYNTASLSPNEPLEKAVVTDGVLSAEHPSGVKIRLELQDDQSLTGTWKFSRYKGTLQVVRDSESGTAET